MASETVTIKTFKTAKSSQSAPSFFIDTSQLKEFGKRLRATSPAVAKVLRLRLHEVGDVVAEAAREEASFSTRIPGSIKVRVSGFGVKIVGNATATGAAPEGTAPDAAPLENKGQSGSFRHPVFGDRENWVDQKAHPFLAPASERTKVQVEEMALSIIDDTLKSVGF
jgi:hypothetical protein